MNHSGDSLVWMDHMIATDTSVEREERRLALEDDPSAGAVWFRTLTTRELDRAYRLAGFILGEAAEAEDATQEALTRAWDRRRRLRDPASAQAWFDRILVNVCRDRLRRRAAVRWLRLPDDVTSTLDPFAAAIAGDTVLQGLASLDADHRIVVVLRFWADLPLDAIADRLGLPVGTVKSRLHYALRQMRGAIEPSAATR